MSLMLRVGLTGGIGSGKSTVARRLAEHGAVVIDADAIAREIVEPGTEGLAEVVAEFGAEVLTADGALNRGALAAKAFADDGARQRLNAILHPKIAARTVERFAEAADDAIVVHDVPLLVENNLAAGYHLVIVVHADEDMRVRRLVESRGMAETDARSRIAAQASPEARRAVADVWLDNNGDRDALFAQVDAVWSERLVPYETNIRLRRARPDASPVIVPSDATWPMQAARALARIRVMAGHVALRMDHIGSTAIPGLPAKDVLDLQVVVPTLADADALAAPLSDAGFVHMDGQEWWDEPVGAEKVWTKHLHSGADPARPVNLHVRVEDSPAWRRALLFRDWMRANPDEVAAYAELKKRLAAEHADSGTVAGYAEAKQPWINEAFGRAEQWAAASCWSPETPSQ
ncbi:dephospho-CoA kinase [Saccharomonospora xinjiangensis XJ-54]|uniref:Dephospho-CoA kinase n=2 Tax=Saccharomonospora TaxID=1851 RepID=I0V6M7_9PSEU|nr:dephospho-CoA kinase [Saccharomonospora xinjiangensis XJ-54]